MTNESQKGKVKYWGMRIGEGGKYVEYAEKGKYIAIGWNGLGNIDWITNQDRSFDDVRNELYESYKRIYGVNESEIAMGVHVGVILKFVRDAKEGDIVVIPDMVRHRALIGRITGSYKYSVNVGDECPYRHRRDVEWLKQIERDDIVPKLKASLNVGLTIFSLERARPEIMTLVVGEGESNGKKEVVTTGEGLVKVIIDRLFNLDPQSFEHFVTHLLTLIGFEATTTQYVGDKGVDVIGTLNPEGIANITLKAQVKRVRGRISNQEILMLRGTLGADEHGVLITTGRFTKQAQSEAEAEGKKPIPLIDGETLVDLILTHYDEMDEKYKELLQLRKREVPIEELFYTTVTKEKP